MSSMYPRPHSSKEATQKESLRRVLIEQFGDEISEEVFLKIEKIIDSDIVTSYTSFGEIRYRVVDDVASGPLEFTYDDVRYRTETDDNGKLKRIYFGDDYIDMVPGEPTVLDGIYTVPVLAFEIGHTITGLYYPYRTGFYESHYRLIASGGFDYDARITFHCQNNKISRTDGPAVYLHDDPSQYMFVECGLLHRTGNLPAVYNSKKIKYFVANHPHRQDGPAVIDLETGETEYFFHGNLHRVDGPARENSYYLYGEICIDLDEYITLCKLYGFMTDELETELRIKYS